MTQADDSILDLFLGARIRQCRFEKGLTVEALADATGIETGVIHELERGVAHDDLMGTLSVHFKVSALWLVTGLGEKHAPDLGARIVLNPDTLQ
ncbi:helix-turn-helix domain-containing protein [Paraburkholderia sp. SIMBA_054]|uniref:helix-turn-helix domain-containing protein n=1 Tax=Paraburkholderia sp. SIMBA_054 TaxID=3085795 RepID=UPI0039782846